MPESVIPKHIREFVANYIDSIAELEALLLLRAHSPHELKATELAARLYISDAEALWILRNLTKKALLKINQKKEFRYAANEAQESMMLELKDVHSQFLVPLTHFIHPKNNHKIQQFADAFRIRKNDD